MAGIKKELDDYLSKKDKSSVKITMPFSFNSMPFDKWYSKSDNSESKASNYENGLQSWCPAMSRFQRLVAFCVFICMGVFCFAVASFYIPVLIFKARKFALLYTLGSFFIICRYSEPCLTRRYFSFAVLWGPAAYMQHMMSLERLPFTSAYLGTLLATLYSAISLQSTFLTCISASGQVMVLLWFLGRHIPGGSSGIRFLSQMCCWASSNLTSSSSSASLVSSTVSSTANAVTKTMQV
ncbi:hypothetical protein J437_LFUL008225 [Ladona fulva]|uniref:Vesicle transport protein n=1 Tax=Ladona fulva TaxID=123851 RepID=A0A8K0K4U1_LADFU|nr:hypothetical protein J437_LFUL008225 [Ladona fulva]